MHRNETDVKTDKDIRIENLSTEALAVFRSKAGKRIELPQSDEELLRNMGLYKDGYLTTEAILLFHSEPEKMIPGAYIQIAYYAPEGAYGQNRADDIIYSDKIHAPLFLQVEKTIDMLYFKYLKALISYDGIQRIETYPYPFDVFQQLLINIILCKSYDMDEPICINVYDDKIVIRSPGQWNSMEDADLQGIDSLNPKISEIFRLSGGMEDVDLARSKEICDRQDVPYPVVCNRGRYRFEVICKACDHYMKLWKHGRYYHTYQH